MYVKRNLLVPIKTSYLKKNSFKRIHTKTYLLGWGEIVLKYFFFYFPIYLIQKMTILAQK